MCCENISLLAEEAKDPGAVPSMELLEFLGEGVKVEEELVDPLHWQSMQEMTQTRPDTGQVRHD